MLPRVYMHIFGVTKLALKHDIIDIALFKIMWEQQPDGSWDKVLYRREREKRFYGTDGPLGKFVMDRYLESNIPNEEYFHRKLAGTI